MIRQIAPRRPVTRPRQPVPPGLSSLAAAALAGLLIAGAADAQNITKCQDAEGNWHYGDFAAEACAEESTITEIDERGITVEESEAPPTAEELEAQQAAEEQERLEAERLARERAEERRLLQTYDSDEAIIRARDQRISALDQELESHQLFRQDLVDERQSLQAGGDDSTEALDRQIEQYDSAIQRLEEQRREVTEEYNRELQRYRELTE